MRFRISLNSNTFFQQTSLLGGTRFGANRENAEVGKAGLGKPRLVNTRAALGNISNRATTGKVEISKVVLTTCLPSCFIK